MKLIKLILLLLVFSVVAQGQRVRIKQVVNLKDTLDVKAYKLKSIFYLSQNGVISNANLSEGSTSFGTDQTSAIQAVLNKGGTANPILIYWDVKASVTGLKIKGNTKIIALPGMGAILRNNSNKPIIRNANAVFGGTIIDSNIIIDGGIWNGNSYNSALSPAQTKGTPTDGATTVFSFYGVRNLIVRDFAIYRQTSYAIHGASVENALYENGIIDAGASGAINSDGVHFDGNSKHCTARNLSIRTFDDAVGLNADDLYTSNTGGWSPSNGFYPSSASGPISDVSIEDVFINAGLFGVRLLSGSSRIDNIRIKNITGATTGYGLIIDNYMPNPALVTNAGGGNVGSVQIENYNVAVTSSSYITANAIIGCNVEKLIFKDFKRNDFTLNTPSILVQNAGTVVGNLIIDGYDSNDTTSTNVIDHIKINAGTTVRNLRILRAVVNRYNVANATDFIGNSGTIGNLSLNGIYTDKIGYILYNDASITSVQAANISQTNGTYVFNTTTTVPELTLSNVRGGTTLTNGTFTTKSGDAYTSGANTFLTGVSGGQTAIGGTATGENLTLKPTAANTTTGKVIFGTLGAYDVANNRLGVGTASPANAIDVTGSAGSSGGVAAFIKNTSATGETYLAVVNDQGSSIGAGTMEVFGSSWADAALRNQVAFSSRKSLFFIPSSGVLTGGTDDTRFYAGGSQSNQERMRITPGGVSIGSQANVNASAILELASTSKGFLLPRMTKAQRDLISSPTDGLAVYQTDNTPGLRVRENGVWVKYTATAD